MKGYLKAAALGFLLLMCLAWFKKDKLPQSSGILPDMRTDPVQIPNRTEPFTTTKEGTTYTITPLFDYELHGLIVSMHHADSWIDFYHKRWGDVLNVKDVCVIWGDNLRNDVQEKFSFKSGDFTCFFQTDDYQAYTAFNPGQVSNNHLLVDDPDLKSAIMGSGIGDQIRLKGKLATYSHPGGFFRGTSTTRIDTGDGACETIFVREFEILKRANPVWRFAFQASKYGLIISVLTLVFLFFREVVGPALSSSPDAAVRFHLKGQSLAARGKFGPALRAFGRALELDPFLAEVYEDRAIVFEQLGKRDRAEADRRAAENLLAEPDPEEGDW